MAVYAAHLTRTAGGPPSVFAVAAQQALADTVKPALARLVQYLSDVYPKCKWMEEWYDELYLVLDAALQHHYLTHYAASFSESFYGLQRVPIACHDEFSAGSRLAARLERGSLVLLVLAPYCWARMGRLIEHWQEEKDEGRLGKSRGDRLRAIFCYIWRALNFARATCALTLLARYAARGGSPTLPLAALGLRLAHAPPVDTTEYGWRDAVKDLGAGRVSEVWVYLGSRLLSGSQYLAFLLLAIRTVAPRGGGAALPCPPPPPPPPPPSQSGSEPRPKQKPGSCALCLRPWRVPTALAVSGYVFCYSCISRHVRMRNECPVTRCPADIHGLVRLYT